MNKELTRVCEMWVDKGNCKSEMWKDNEGLYNIMLEGLAEFSFNVIISETNKYSYDPIEKTISTIYYGECTTDFGKYRKKAFRSTNLWLMLVDIETFLNAQKEHEEAKKKKHELTGRYGLISETLEGGQKRVINSFPEYMDDDYAMEYRCKEIILALNEQHADRKYTYDIVYL